ncbi:MAG: hypothetical protein H6867_06710 [Rhodospirillales bacterium]|nr:hypothetical protein [Rhodospirillales bacterium]MCB9995240.1 hypothetical protein [Rhodospirillales bacterium]
MKLFKAFMDSVLPGKGPKAVTKVKGFTIDVEKKQGVLLTSTPKDRPDAQPQAASADYYYEVSITPNGKNREYPAQDKPWKARFTIGADDKSGYGFASGAALIPRGAEWTRFELVEDFDDGKPTASGSYRIMPPHHYIMLRAHFRDARGRDTKMALGGQWVRKSETETEAWQAALKKPVRHFF